MQAVGRRAKTLGISPTVDPHPARDVVGCRPLSRVGQRQVTRGVKHDYVNTAVASTEVCSVSLHDLCSVDTRGSDGPHVELTIAIPHPPFSGITPKPSGAGGVPTDCRTVFRPSYLAD